MQLFILDDAHVDICSKDEPTHTVTEWYIGNDTQSELGDHESHLPEEDSMGNTDWYSDDHPQDPTGEAGRASQPDPTMDWLVSDDICPVTAEQADQPDLTMEWYMSDEVPVEASKPPVETHACKNRLRRLVAVSLGLPLLLLLHGAFF